MPRDEGDIEAQSGHLLTHTRVLHIDVESINNGSSFNKFSSAATRFAHSRTGILSFIALILMLLLCGIWVNFVATGVGSDSGLPVELDAAMQRRMADEASLSHDTVVLEENKPTSTIIDSSPTETLNSPPPAPKASSVDLTPPSAPSEAPVVESVTPAAPHWLGANAEELPPMPHAIPPHSPLASQYVPSPEIRLGMTMPMQPISVPGTLAEKVDAYAIAPTERTQIQPLAFVSQEEREEQRQATKNAQQQQLTATPPAKEELKSAEGLAEFKPPVDSEPILSVPVIAAEANAPAANMETIVFVDPNAVSRVDSMQIDSSSQKSTVQPVDQSDAAAIQQLSQAPEYEKPQTPSTPATAATMEEPSTPAEFAEPTSANQIVPSY